MNTEQTPGITLYTRVASLLRSRILSGEWAVGSILPPIPKLCELYGVGTITIRQALRILAAEGLIESKRGRGTTVTKGIVPVQHNRPLRQAINDPLELGPDQTIRILQVEQPVSLPQELMRPGLPQAEYVRVKKIHFYKKTPFALIDIYVIKEAFDRFPKGAEASSKIGLLLRNDGSINLVNVEQEVTIVPRMGELDQYLSANSSDFAVSNVVVKILKWWKDSTGQIAFAGIHHYRADMFVLEIKRDVQDFYVTTEPGLIPTPSQKPAKKASS
ncbi:GntR family transcriptional regulator [Roseomonas marmotae]|nr:GntR family transcriptional regulator [Roseomonas marmotae]